MTWDDWFRKSMRTLGPWSYDMDEFMKEMEKMFEAHFLENMKNYAVMPLNLAGVSGSGKVVEWHRSGS